MAEIYLSGLRGALGRPAHTIVRHFMTFNDIDVQRLFEREMDLKPCMAPPNTGRIIFPRL